MGILEVTNSGVMHMFVYTHTQHWICPWSKQKCKTTENRKSFANSNLLKACITSIASAEGLGWLSLPSASFMHWSWLIIISYWHQQIWGSAILVDLHMLQSHLTAMQTFCRHQRAFKLGLCTIATTCELHMLFSSTLLYPHAHGKWILPLWWKSNVGN